MFAMQFYCKPKLIMKFQLISRTKKYLSTVAQGYRHMYQEPQLSKESVKYSSKGRHATGMYITISDGYILKVAKCH